MPQPALVILYVDQPLDSAAFYARLLGKAPMETAPTFAMFALDCGLRFGLWSRHTVEPPASPVGGCELAFAVESRAAVDALHDAWIALGLRIAQAPTALDFGYTFVALDRDGHRLRAFWPDDMPADALDAKP